AFPPRLEDSPTSPTKGEVKTQTAAPRRILTGRRADPNWPHFVSNGSENFGSAMNFGSLSVFRNATSAAFSAGLKRNRPPGPRGPPGPPGGGPARRPSRLACGFTPVL